MLSAAGTKLTLSLKDADQKNGADLTPHMRLPGQAAPAGASSGGASTLELREAGGAGGASSNPSRPAGAGSAPGKWPMADDDDEPKRATKRLTSPERFEAQQLIASGVLDVRDYPQFDAEAGGMLATALEDTEAEIEIELNEAVGAAPMAASADGALMAPHARADGA